MTRDNVIIYNNILIQNSEHCNQNHLKFNSTESTSLEDKYSVHSKKKDDLRLHCFKL